MEIPPLLQSNALPTDVVLNNVYGHLWRIKSPLTNDLKAAIENDNFHFNKIFMGYYNDRTFTHDEEDDMYYLDWMINDIVWMMNDRQTLMDGVSDTLKNDFPWITQDYMFNDDYGKQNDKVYQLWLAMTPDKKLEMYDWMTCNVQ